MLSFTASCGTKVTDVIGATRTLVDTGEGKLSITDIGEGRAVVLLHGLIASSYCWRRLIPELARTHRVIAIDALAHGASDRVLDADYSLAGHAKRALGVCERLGIESATWVGTSYGGTVALEAAVQALGSSRVGALVLVSPAHPFAPQALALARWYGMLPGRMVARTYPFAPQRLFRWAMGRMYADPSKVTAEVAFGYFQPLKNKGTVRCQLRSVIAYGDDMRKLEDDLPKLKTLPVRLIWGDLDPVIPLESARRLEEALGDVRLSVIPGTGHPPYEEAPERFERLLMEILAEERV